MRCVRVCALSSSSLLNRRQIYAGHHLKFMSSHCSYLYADASAREPPFILLLLGKRKTKNKSIKIDCHKIAHAPTQRAHQMAFSARNAKSLGRRTRERNNPLTMTMTRCATEHGKAFYLFRFTFYDMQFRFGAVFGLLRHSRDLLYGRIQFPENNELYTVTCLVIIVIVVVAVLDRNARHEPHTHTR